MSEVLNSNPDGHNQYTGGGSSSHKERLDKAIQESLKGKVTGVIRKFEGGKHVGYEEGDKHGITKYSKEGRITGFEPHPGQTSHERRFAPKKPGATTNSWSDAAREAAAAARSAKGAAPESKTAYKFSRDAHEASKEASGNTTGHKIAAEHHEMAAEQHQVAAGKRKEAGDEAGAKAHSDAAAAHTKASEEHYGAIKKHFTGNALKIGIQVDEAISEAEGIFGRTLTINERQEVTQDLLTELIDNASVNQPRCPKMGHYKSNGAGTGHGPFHDAAVDGYTDRDADYDNDDEEVENSNPQGHNQYTDSGGKALKVGDRVTHKDGGTGDVVRLSEVKGKQHAQVEYDGGTFKGHHPSELRKLGDTPLKTTADDGNWSLAKAAGVDKVKPGEGEDKPLVVKGKAHSMHITDNEGTNNQRQPGEETVSTRKRALQVLTANCRCQEDKAALNKLSDTTLISLAENALFKKGNKGGKREDDDEEDEDDEDEEVVDNGDDPFDAGGVGEGGHVPFNPGQMGDRAGKKPAANKKPTDNIIYGDDCEGEDNDDPECRAMFAKKGTANVKKPTFNQLLAAADPETRESIQQGQLALRRQKDRIVRGLVGNVVDDKSRQAMYKKYMQKSLPELNELLLIRGPQGMPTRNSSEQEEPIFIGAGADADVVFNDAGDGDETGILPLPVQNYSNP